MAFLSLSSDRKNENVEPLCSSTVFPINDTALLLRTDWSEEWHLKDKDDRRRGISEVILCSQT